MSRRSFAGGSVSTLPYKDVACRASCSKSVNKTIIPNASIDLAAAFTEPPVRSISPG